MKNEIIEVLQRVNRATQAEIENLNFVANQKYIAGDIEASERLYEYAKKMSDEQNKIHDMIAWVRSKDE